ncbi:WD40 repeat domain-containing protein [Naegleria gruberi]|uniref:WD40 repeat domain-containing protein n=1 Tax=Naegleria gruberi TaxID=5762 RepID=D2V9T0_NAEGR|nr:WD40 repeat domain-containing protein [Naegleria gruberi]EFC46191.1 WD40 repeat domain-containing protein [Naegleria gruberi]|eukprot:XP_002678935.1 WD40 repeat domain-containing protein [Naegleria gruberi strain NEG-M]
MTTAIVSTPTPHRTSLGGGGSGIVTNKHISNSTTNNNNNTLIIPTSSNNNLKDIKYTCGGIFNSKPILIDNENIIVIAVSQTIKIYSSNTGKQLNEIIHHTKKITQIIKDDCNENQIYSVSEDGLLSTGDGHGVISLYFSDGTKSSHHWHPSMVTNLQFSEEGDYLYSSGIEGVVVCWRLPSLKKDKFLVTDCSISNFMLSSNQDDIFILGKDNIIRKYEFARFNLIYRIYVINEPNSNYILMNGTNSLQWFNINDSTIKHYESIQFRDVKYDPSRFINSESKPIKNIIEHLAFNQNANYLAHVESFNQFKQNLKFWKLDNNNMNMNNMNNSVNGSSDNNDSTNNTNNSGISKKMKPKLITVIDNPHSDKITQLLFNNGNNNQCLTSSIDGKIRIWNLTSELFTCQAILEYKNLPCYSFDISKDGTLLCAVFGNEITLWDLERFELIESYNYPYQLLDCKFINDDYIAIISDRYISLFSLLFDNKNLWTIDAGHVQSLITNQNEQFACIVNGSEIIQFSLNNNTINNTNISSYPMVNYHLDTDHFLQSLFYKNNQLYFLNKQFEIYNIINSNNNTTTNNTSTTTSNVNGSTATATTTTINNNKNEKNEEQSIEENGTIKSIYDKKWKSSDRISLMELQRVNTVPFATDIGNRAWKEIFNAPSHSLISMSSCYSTFMNTFILKSINKNNTFNNSNDNNTTTTTMNHQYATLVPNTQSSSQQQQHVEESCVPSADLIRFINNYSKQ